ncbi:MAG: phosphatase PAP2 family protein [Chthoniobacteraceae bacterium]
MDEKLLLLINRDWTSPALDRVMAGASSFDAWAPPLILFLIFVLVLGGFRARAFIITAALLVGVSDGLISKTLKRVIDRPRPHQSHDDVRVVDLGKAKPRLLALAQPAKVKLSQRSVEDVEGRSFPSSHTMNTLAVALAGAAFFGWRAWGLFAMAGLVAYSRIYTGSHWPSDVLVSIFLGAGTSLLMLALAAAGWRTLGAKWLTQIHAQHPSLFA